MMETTLQVYWLSSENARNIKQMWREGGKPLGNDYYYIVYKDGSIIVYDRSYDESDGLPSLNLNNVIYISTWFKPYGELYVNPKLSQSQIESIIKAELYDEDGNLYYNNIEFGRDFPYWEYEI